MPSQILQQSLGTLRSLAGRGDYMANLLIKVFDELLVGQKGGITARFASIANRAALSGLANTGLDGTPVAGDIILLKDQTDGRENGLYTASAGAWSRVLDENGAVLLGPNMLIPVREGATLADKAYQVTSNRTIVGTDFIIFGEFGGSSGFTGGPVLGATTFFSDVTIQGSLIAGGAPVNLNALFDIGVDGVVQAGINGGDFKILADGTNKLAEVPGDKIAEYGAAGSLQLAHMAHTAGQTLAQTQAKVDLLIDYLIARGTMAAS